MTLRHTTLDPGGLDAQGGVLPPVVLVVEGQVDELELDHAIIGPVVVSAGGLLEKLTVRDAAMDASQAGGVALDLPATRGHFERATIIGSVDLNGLYATDTLIAGGADVTDTQAGCFRFSAAPAGSRLPAAATSRTVLADMAALFTSRRFGDPGYAAALARRPPPGCCAAPRAAPRSARSAACSTPIKLDGLRAKVDEYMPFGLVPFFVSET